MDRDTTNAYSIIHSYQTELMVMQIVLTKYPSTIWTHLLLQGFLHFLKVFSTL